MHWRVHSRRLIYKLQTTTFIHLQRCSRSSEQVKSFLQVKSILPSSTTAATLESLNRYLSIDLIERLSIAAHAPSNGWCTTGKSTSHFVRLFVSYSIHTTWVLSSWYSLRLSFTQSYFDSRHLMAFDGMMATRCSLVESASCSTN